VAHCSRPAYMDHTSLCAALGSSPTSRVRSGLPRVQLAGLCGATLQQAPLPVNSSFQGATPFGQVFLPAQVPAHVSAASLLQRASCGPAVMARRAGWCAQPSVIQAWQAQLLPAPAFEPMRLYPPRVAAAAMPQHVAWNQGGEQIRGLVSSGMGSQCGWSLCDQADTEASRADHKRRRMLLGHRRHSFGMPSLAAIPVDAPLMAPAHHPPRQSAHGPGTRAACESGCDQLFVRRAHASTPAPRGARTDRVGAHPEEERVPSQEGVGGGRGQAGRRAVSGAPRTPCGARQLQPPSKVPFHPGWSCGIVGRPQLVPKGVTTIGLGLVQRNAMSLLSGFHRANVPTTRATRGVSLLAVQAASACASTEFAPADRSKGAHCRKKPLKRASDTVRARRPSRLNASKQSSAARGSRDSRHQFRGVTRAGHQWRAKIFFAKGSINLGHYKSATAAAMAYDIAARDLRGQPRLNFPSGHWPDVDSELVMEVRLALVRALQAKQTSIPECVPVLRKIESALERGSKAAQAAQGAQLRLAPQTKQLLASSCARRGATQREVAYTADTVATHSVSGSGACTRAVRFVAPRAQVECQPRRGVKRRRKGAL